MADKWRKFLNIWLPSGFIDTSQYTQGHARLARPTLGISSSDPTFPFPFPIVTQVTGGHFFLVVKLNMVQDLLSAQTTNRHTSIVVCLCQF